MNFKQLNTKPNAKRGLTSAIIAAIAASICCVGPLVLLALGVSGAWVGNLTALVPFRPYFIGVTVLFLAYAFHRIYRKPKVEDCAPGSYCANPKSDKINKITLWISTIFIIALLATPYIAETLAARENAAADRLSEQLANLKEVTLDVPDMHCPSCPFTVQKSLKALDGVVSAKATLEDKEAKVIYQPSKVTINKLIEATTNAGYPSTVAE